MSKPTVRPIGGNILVKPMSQEKISTSGIVLPDTVNKEKPQKGEIISLGNGKRSSDGKIVEFNVKVGDIVMFKKYSPDELEIDGEDYLIMDEDAILCVL